MFKLKLRPIPSLLSFQSRQQELRALLEKGGGGKSVNGLFRMVVGEFMLDESWAKTMLNVWNAIRALEELSQSTR